MPKAKSSALDEYVLRGDAAGLASRFRRSPVAQLRKVAQSIAKMWRARPKETITFIKALSRSDSEECRQISGYAAGVLASQEWSDDIQGILLRLADDPIWPVREAAGFGIQAALEQNYEQVYPTLREWSEKPNPNIRRAVLVALRPSYRGEWNEQRVNQLLDLVGTFLTEQDEYVRKNVPWVLRFFRNYPDLVLPRLAAWAKNPDERVRRHVAMTCEGTLAKTRSREVLEILRVLVSDKRPSVSKAVTKALRRVKAENPKLVHQVLSDWRTDTQLIPIVDTILS